MYKFLLFLKKIQFVLLFVVIEVIAINYYTGSSSYNQAKMINVSNYLVGDIYAAMSKVGHYFLLKNENEKLTKEIALLRGDLERYRSKTTANLAVDSLMDTLGYSYTSAIVINNSLTRQDNFLTLNSGADDSVYKDMSIICGGAIVGYVLTSSDRFSVAMSVLNSKFKTSGRLKGQDYFGPVYWDGRNSTELVLTEIPKYAKIEVGDTIVTTEYSSIFPPDILIGTISSFELINATYYEARIKLFADMSALKNVVVVRYLDREEKRKLEEPFTGDVSGN